MSVWGQSGGNDVQGGVGDGRQQVRVPYPPVLGGGRPVSGAEERRGTLRRPHPVAWQESFARQAVRLWVDVGAVDLVPAPRGSASARPSGVLAEGDVAYVVTGTSVFGRLSTLREGRETTRALRDDLDVRHWLWRLASVFDPQRWWAQAGAVVTDPNVTEEDVDGLAARLGQGAFLRWDERGLTCVPTGVGGRDYPRVPVPVQAFPAQSGCPIRFGASAQCKPEGGPWVSASVSAALVWEHHRCLLVEALGC
ncbi:MAG TPA: hypothetical protein VFJ12_06035, partial [Segeticoccus sp.]|nr:hypothetical protein [Segeticoccus sp.]